MECAAFNIPRKDRCNVYVALTCIQGSHLDLVLNTALEKCIDSRVEQGFRAPTLVWTSL